jgi:glutamate:GABA antiporter
MEEVNNSTAAGVSAVESHSRELRKEVGLGALVLTQIMYVVGTGWLGTAAKLGHAETALWLLAILLFFLPQAAVVSWLNTRLPLEGGLYQWAKLGFNDVTGFLTAWNLWLFTILNLSAFGLIVASNTAYLLGPSLAAFTATNTYTALVTVLVLAGTVVVATLGLRVGKWVQSLGGVAQLAAFAALIVAPLVALRRGVVVDPHPIRLVMPVMSVLTLNIFGKMAMGALSGLEYVAIMAGETKDPARAIRRSVLIATPIIGAMFILGTASVVALVPRDRIDLIAPVPQTLTLGWGGGLVMMVVTASLVVRHLANVNFIFAGNVRLPMVAGWDGRLPAWFTRLDPRWRTPRNAIVFVATIIFLFALLGLAGTGQQEAFQLLDSAAGTLYGFSYLVMFALPLLAPQRLGARAPLWLRLAALSGFAVTLLYCVLNVVPIIDVPNVAAFTAKVSGVILATNALGVALFVLARRGK